jgi:HAD superfamily hydrolase (TIGR01549 family)
MAVIFDLDRTLVDSSSSKELRRLLRWPEVFATIPQFKVYTGIPELLEVLTKGGFGVGIATSSYEAYALKVIDKFRFEPHAVVCREHTRMHKPHPEPLLLAAKRLGRNPIDCWAIGDEPRDIIAANCAGMVSVAASWGSPDTPALKQSQATIWCDQPQDLISLLV